MKMPHIKLDENTGASLAILPGDPARVERIAMHMEDVVDLGMSREYRSITGIYKGKRILAMSTGMGGPAAAIAVEELVKLGYRALIRIGSAGGLKDFLSVGDLVIATAAVRDDGASRSYIDPQYPAVADFDLTGLIRKKAEELDFPHALGIVRTHDAMYSDRNPMLYEKWSSTPVIASDMETASILTVSSLRGIRAASILNIVAVHNSDVPHSVGRYSSGEDEAMQGEAREIILALETLSAFAETL